MPAASTASASSAGGAVVRAGHPASRSRPGRSMSWPSWSRTARRTQARRPANR